MWEAEKAKKDRNVSETRRNGNREKEANECHIGRIGVRGAVCVRAHAHLCCGATDAKTPQSARGSCDSSPRRSDTPACWAPPSAPLTFAS